MQCLNISNKQVKAAVDEAAAALGSEDAAYYVISENNGYGLDYTPDGVQSILFQSLLDLYDGTRELALQAKARAYSKQFRNQFGDWVNSINYNDIIFGHPGIGKTFSFDNGKYKNNTGKSHGTG